MTIADAIKHIKKLESEIDDILDTPEGIENQDELTRLRIALMVGVDALEREQIEQS